MEALRRFPPAENKKGTVTAYLHVKGIVDACTRQQADCVRDPLLCQIISPASLSWPYNSNRKRR